VANGEAATSIDPWKAVGGIAFCGGLVFAGYRWPDLWLIEDAGQNAAAQPFIEVAKLAIAAGIGTFVTTVHHPAAQSRKSTQPVAYAQILFCVAGALMMIIIGNSLARAFGAVGIASIVRFRTALKDPQDATILFLLIGLGMSAGRGIVAVAGLGTLFVCALLWIMDRVKEEKPRAAMLELRASGPEFPGDHVQRVFARHHLTSDTREMEHGAEAMIRYHVVLHGTVSPEAISAQLIGDGQAGIKSARWEMIKRKGE
jgi:hypothetical protein